MACQHTRRALGAGVAMVIGVIGAGSTAAPTCFEGTANAGPGCNHLPTSLPCLKLDGPCRGSLQQCFQGDMESSCGFKIVFLFIVVECGPPIASGAC